MSLVQKIAESIAAGVIKVEEPKFETLLLKVKADNPANFAVLMTTLSTVADITKPYVDATPGKFDDALWEGLHKAITDLTTATP
jgi:hypothetical protein